MVLQPAGAAAARSPRRRRRRCARPARSGGRRPGSPEPSRPGERTVAALGQLEQAPGAARRSHPPRVSAGEGSAPAARGPRSARTGCPVRRSASGRAAAQRQAPEGDRGDDEARDDRDVAGHVPTPRLRRRSPSFMASTAYDSGSTSETAAQHVRQPVAGHEQPAQQELRQDEGRHELHGLELGPREARSTSRPERRAEQGVDDGDDDQQPERPGDVEAAHPDRRTPLPPGPARRP